MKKIVVACFLLSWALLTNAQTNSQWKLSTHTWNGAGWTGKWEYKYDSNFLLKQVNYYQDKKLFSTSKNFTHNAAGNITSYEDVYLQGADPQKFYFTYNQKNELESKKTIFYKKGKENYTTVSTYIWEQNKVTENKTVTSKYGTSTSTIIYNLDSKKNITSKERKEEYSSSVDKYVDIDITPNPFVQVDYPYHGEVISPNNSTFVAGTTSPSTKKIKVNNVGLTVSITETINNGKYNIINTDNYGYIKINSIKK